MGHGLVVTEGGLVLDSTGYFWLYGKLDQGVSFLPLISHPFKEQIQEAITNREFLEGKQVSSNVISFPVVNPSGESMGGSNPIKVDLLSVPNE